jgi:hypothetical protein
MELKIHTKNNISIAEVVSEKIEIKTVQDALDLLGNADYLGARKIIVHEKNIIADFFELKTRLAGDILQKFSNYQVDFAIIGDFENVTSKSLHDFIYESNKGGRVLFLPSVADVLARWGAVS